MPDDATFRLLIVSDIHYGPMELAGLDFLPKRRCAMGAELVRRALAAAGRVDAVAVVGDLLEDGTLPGSRELLVELRDVLATADAPALVIPGNHDGDYEAVYETFSCRPGLHTLTGRGGAAYRFFLIADRYASDNVCTRDPADQAALGAVAAEKVAPPLVVIQHNPMNPYIESEYPFMLTNRDAVMRDYAAWGLWLSLSGHYHPGQPLNVAGGVRYFTSPCLAEWPFRCTAMTFRGRHIDVEPLSLARPDELPPPEPA
jgi:3',5'-cyclic AMP phosphodiesterase CpdA